MRVSGISGAGNGVQTGNSRNVTQMDSVSKSIQTQIANVQKKLQELSSNQELSMEDKMKKRQAIQQEIYNLNLQLRQHQLEQRKEQQAKKTSSDNAASDSRKTLSKSGTQGAGLSQAGMQAMISADSSLKQAKVQGSAATKMEGRANVLKSEIEADRGRGADTQKKMEEQEELTKKAQNLAGEQASTLAAASKTMKEAAQTEGNAKTEAGTVNDRKEKSREAVNGAGQKKEEVI